MGTSSIHPVPRSGRRVLTEHEWAWAKADYLDGFAAPQIAAAYGMGVSTLRERAAREGWRRADEDARPPAALSDDDASDPDIDPLDEITREDEDVGVMADLAWRRAALALKTGDRHAARTWLHLHEKLLPILRELTEDMMYERRSQGASAPAAPPAPARDVPRPPASAAQACSPASPVADPAARPDAPDALDALDASLSAPSSSDLHLSAARGALLHTLSVGGGAGARPADPP